MSRSRLLFLSVLVLALVTGACDRMPVDPQDPASELALMPGDPSMTAGARAPLSLPALLHSAVERVYREQGASAARTLVSDLRRLHRAAQEAASEGNREEAAARLRELRDEELRIVLFVFGDAAAARVIDAVTADVARLRERLDELGAAGHPLPRAAEILAEVHELLVDADVAYGSGDARAALDAGTRAAALVAGVRARLADAARLPALEQLFERAVAQLRAHAPQQLRTALAEYHRLEQAAREAVRAGRREEAHAALQAVRREEIRIVLRVLGPGAVSQMLERARTAAGTLETALTAAGSSGRDVVRLERMMSSALDMLQRAEDAFARGEAAAALDLGSHAVGLLNAVRLAL